MREQNKNDCTDMIKPTGCEIPVQLQTAIDLT